MEGMIDVTAADLRALISAAYDLSVPLGFGLLHAKPGPLPDDVIDKILARGDERIAVSMDYVIGRSVKMSVLRKDGRLWIRDNWHDHTAEQLADLLKRVGVMPTLDEHNRQVELAEAVTAQKAGVACPRCRTEMVVDRNAIVNVNLGSGVKCPRCGHFGIKLK